MGCDHFDAEFNFYHSDFMPALDCTPFSMMAMRCLDNGILFHRKVKSFNSQCNFLFAKIFFSKSKYHLFVCILVSSGQNCSVVNGLTEN